MKQTRLSRFIFAHRSDLAAMLCVSIFGALFFWPFLSGSKILIIGDAYYYSYPLRTIAWDMIRRGILPLWTPLLLSGYPLLSMAPLGIGYPLTWGYLFFSGYRAEQIYILVPYLLAPAFVYAYAREINRSRLASLLAGFVFGYGGLMASGIATNGMLPNAVMWLPLTLIAIERARVCRFAYCLLAMTAAYTMSVLSGIGQGFLFVGTIALGYGAYISAFLIWEGRGRQKTSPSWRRWAPWRPFFVAVGGIFFSAGIAAFQILETMRAVNHSVRRVLSYASFTEGSYQPLLQFQSFFAPFYHHGDTEAYVLPLAVLLAAVAVASAKRNPRRDVRVFFWLIVAATGWVLMMGEYTPLYRVVYHLPIFNRFRVPARHTFEWTFAVGILSAYGCDAVCRSVRRRGEISDLHLPQRRRAIVIAAAAVGLIFLIGSGWWAETGRPRTAHPEIRYWLFKLLFTALTIIAFWLSCRIRKAPWRKTLLATTICLSCFVEPYIFMSRLLFPLAKTRESLSAVSPVTRFLQQYSPEQNRIYTRCQLFTEYASQAPPLETHNVTALYGLQNVGGYEPLIFERYSRAFGHISLDFYQPRVGFPPDGNYRSERSHVLDLLNDTFLVSCTDQNDSGQGGHAGLRETNGEINLKPGATKKLTRPGGEVEAITLVSTLANSANLADGEPVATLRLTSPDNRFIERKLLAGKDTAEWAHERPDVRDSVRHNLAPIFDSSPGDINNSFTAHRYRTIVSLDEPFRIDRLEITNVTQKATLTLWGMTFNESSGKHSVPAFLAEADNNEADQTTDGAGKWERVYAQQGVVIEHNQRALPRAWLVAEAEAVEEEAALRAIRGEGAHQFDPRRTALLEVRPSELPVLPGGWPSHDAAARIISYQPGRIEIETTAPTPTVLMVSEINYPGWEAQTDGASRPLLQADYLLRGIFVPAGAHRIEMRYKAPGARAGGYVSIFSLLLLGCICLWQRWALRNE